MGYVNIIAPIKIASFYTPWHQQTYLIKKNLSHTHQLGGYGVIGYWRLVDCCTLSSVQNLSLCYFPFPWSGVKVGYQARHLGYQSKAFMAFRSSWGSHANIGYHGSKDPALGASGLNVHGQT
jgi:hypothetical protein